MIGNNGLDVEEILTYVGVKMVVHGDSGVRKVPDGRKEGGKVEGPGNLMTKVSLDKHEES